MRNEMRLAALQQDGATICAYSVVELIFKFVDIAQHPPAIVIFAKKNEHFVCPVKQQQQQRQPPYQQLQQRHHGDLEVAPWYKCYFISSYTNGCIWVLEK